jgi:parallel beta-helix repeat protein
MKPSFDSPGRSALISAFALASALAAGTSYAEDPASRSARHPIAGKTVINRPGSYVLRRGITLQEAGDAILITASNVSLDLDGHTLRGPGGKQGVGIRVQGATGVRVHGGIVARFGIGVQISDSNNVRIEGLQVYGEDAGGPPPGEVGVLIVNSRGVVVEGNVVASAFLGIFVRGGGSGGNRIANNTLTGGTNGQIGICYNPDGSGDPTGPSGDLVYNNLSSRWNIGIQTSAGTSGNVFRENALAYFQVAFQEVGANQNVLEGNNSIAITP